MKLKLNKKILTITIIVIIVILLISASLFGLARANKNKIVCGLKIANISVGGSSISEAQVKISKEAEEFFKKDIILRYGNGNDKEIWTALPEKIGVKIKIGFTLAKASKIGHQGKFFSDIGQQVLAFFGQYNLSLDYQINEIHLENFIREKLNSIDNPAINAGLQYNKENKNFVKILSQEGMIIDRQDFKLNLQKKIGKLTEDDIYLNLINDYPEILDNETKEAYIKAKEILVNTPYKLTINNPFESDPIEISLTKEKIIPLIEFRPVLDEKNPKNKILGVTFNEQNLNNYLAALSPSIYRSPIDAQFTMEENRVTNFSLSQDGLKLEIERNIQKLQEKIQVGETKIELEVSIIPPKIASKNINNLGITSLMGKGGSNFGGSPSNRIHNIKLGAAKFHGILIKPGEEFSFNTILGEVGPEQGYKPELVIKKDKTTPEYGGGLCQVSTTTFRAAVYSGLPITERYPHAFPVVYYAPQGFDATIYPPHPDFRFINNTPGYLLIQTKIEGSELFFEFYGTDDGRKVEVDGPHQYDVKSDGSMKTKLIRRIYKNNELTEEKTWHSTYKSPSLYPVIRNPLE